MRIDLLPREGTFYKANLHTHSTVSDGALTPAELKEVYKAQGYSILAITDHGALVPHTELTDDTFVAITSYEADTNAPDDENGYFCRPTYHMNLYARDPHKSVSAVFTPTRVWPPHCLQYMSEEAKKVDFRREYNVESINAFIAKAKEDGFLVTLNHPNWSLQRYPDYAGLRGLWGVEWYNTGCERSGYPDNMQPIDDLLALGERVFPLATDDAHDSRENLRDYFGGFLMVKAARLDYDTVFAALERGDFYSSWGPTIEELYIEDGKLHVVSSPAARVTLLTERRQRKLAAAGEGDALTHTVFDLADFDGYDANFPNKKKPSYFRVSVTDASGAQAQTRAYFRDEWEK